jgi:hypothetical protein
MFQVACFSCTLKGPVQVVPTGTAPLGLHPDSKHLAGSRAGASQSTREQEDLALWGLRVLTALDGP